MKRYRNKKLTALCHGLPCTLALDDCLGTPTVPDDVWLNYWRTGAARLA